MPSPIKMRTDYSAPQLRVLAKNAKTNSQSRSCPAAWCNKLGLITAFAGLCRVGQVATAGSPTRGVWLNGAMVSSVM